MQAQVVNMLEDLQSEFGLTYLFIAHDLSMVRHISDRIGVMYGGRLVEVAESDELYDNPQHPYTKALLSSILETDPLKASQRIRLDAYSVTRGDEEAAVLREVSPGHYVAGDFTD